MDMTNERWEIDSSHSSIHFSVRHLMIAKVHGQFSKWSGALLAPDGDLRKAGLTVTIDAASIDTGVADRDAHLRSADFFDVEKYPEVTFKAVETKPAGTSRFDLSGLLTIKGTTQPVTLSVDEAGRATDPWGNTRAVFSAKGAISRKDFGLTWNQALETGGVMVGDYIEIEIDIEAVKQAAAKVA
jgi:polyisoprenoid-binding protein YceI